MCGHFSWCFCKTTNPNIHLAVRSPCMTIFLILLYVFEAKMRSKIELGSLKLLWLDVRSAAHGYILVSILDIVWFSIVRY
jgi:hypothetical protein